MLGVAEAEHTRLLALSEPSAQVVRVAVEMAVPLLLQVLVFPVLLIPAAVAAAELTARATLWSALVVLAVPAV